MNAENPARPTPERLPQGRRPRTMLDRARDALGARMTKDALRLVLENVVTYATSLQTRVAELEDELVVERLPYRERAEQETSPARRAAWLQLAAAEESEARLERLLVAPADDDPVEGDGITRRIAPTQALRDDEPAGYPPALPWAALMDDEDLSDFLDELADAAGTPGTYKAALAEVEATCGRWRAIAEAQHAHNTAPGPDAAEAGDAS